MKFICLGYIDESQWDALPTERRQQMMEECFAYDDELRRGGHFLGGEALETARHAVTLLAQNGDVQVTDGPYPETKEVLGGILLLEARDLNHAIALMSKHPGVRSGPFEIRAAAEDINRQIAARDAAVAHQRPSVGDAAATAEIRELIAAWSKALEAKNAAEIASNYAPDALLFDAIPPYKTTGADNIRKTWENCLPYFPESFRSEHRDLIFHVDGDLAFVHGLHHFVSTPAGHPCGQSWMRITVCFRRTRGRWKVVHEHVSIPFNPMDNRAWQITNPDVADMPSYGEPSACSPSQEKQA